MRKNCCSDLEKLLELKADGWELAINVEIMRTIYSNNERSEFFLKQYASLSYSWSFLRSNTIDQSDSEFKLEKITGIYKPKGKNRK